MKTFLISILLLASVQAWADYHVNLIADPWSNKKPVINNEDPTELSTAACSLHLDAALGHTLEGMDATDKIKLLRAYGVPAYLYIRTNATMTPEAPLSFNGLQHNPMPSLGAGGDKLLEILSLVKTDAIGSIDLDEFYALRIKAKEWQESEDKCRTWPDYPEPGYYVGQIKTLIADIRKYVGAAQKSPAADPLYRLNGMDAFEGRLAAVRARLESQAQTLNLAQGRGGKVDKDAVKRLSSAVSAVNRIFNGKGAVLTPAALYNVVASVSKEDLNDDEWALLARHFPMGEDILRHQAMDAWRAGFTGQGVKVAVIDTGADERHPAFTRPFSANVVKNPFRKTGDDAAILDAKGEHGTSVMSAVAALAPQAELVNIKVYDENNIGEDQRPLEIRNPDVFANSFIRALNEAVKQGATVINLSTFHGLLPNTAAPGWDKVHDKLKELSLKGVVIVAASGNQGKDKDKTLQELNLSKMAASPYVLAVGAADYFGRLTSFSSRSQVNDPASKKVYSKPDVTSYGEAVRVAKFQSNADYDRAENGLFTPNNGTSFASPQVAAIAALAIQKAKLAGLKPSSSYIRKLIKRTAALPDSCTQNAACDKTGYGAGLVSIKDLLESIGTSVAKAK
ncbi:MAG: S8/S53 family peptidase [Elusimicrobiota bacterium]